MGDGKGPERLQRFGLARRRVSYIRTLLASVVLVAHSCLRRLVPHLAPFLEVIGTLSHVAEPSALQEKLRDFLRFLILILELGVQFEAEESLLGDSHVVCTMSCIRLAVLLTDEPCTLKELIEGSKS